MVQVLEANLQELGLHFFVGQDEMVVDWIAFSVKVLLSLYFDLGSLYAVKDWQDYAFDHLLMFLEAAVKSFLDQEVPVSEKHPCQF